jgi:hypothetical protein
MGRAGIVIYRRLLVASILAMLLFPMLGIKMHFAIQERNEPILQPKQLWHGFVKGEWQGFLEQRFLDHMRGVRSFLVLCFNEAKHRLFHKRPNEQYLWARKLGYYPVDTIRRLNSDVLHRDAVKQHYQRAAHRLRILQDILSYHGVALLVVVAPPKVRVYPEYAAPYLIAPPEAIIGKAVSYGDVLEEDGVNVINVQNIFAERKATCPPFFTTTSFHWNFWAGCTIASEIMRKAHGLIGRALFTVDCSDVQYGKSKWADTDIAVILNIFSTDAAIGKAPFPNITPQQNFTGKSPKIVIIGDSFADQLVYTLSRAVPEMTWAPDWLTRYDKLSWRQTAGLGGKLSPMVRVTPDGLLSEILTKELLVFEVSDGTIYREATNLNAMEYGGTQVLLDGLLAKTNAKVIDPRNFLTDGWRANGSEQWRTSGDVASFVVRPPTDGKAVQLAFDVENLSPDQSKPRFLKILLDDKSIGGVTIPPGRGVVELTLPGVAKWQDPLVAEVSLRDTSGQPLDLRLHRIRAASAEMDKTTDEAMATEAAPPTQIFDHSRTRTIDLFKSPEPDDISVEGLSGLESDGESSWRWALGPATRIKFYVDPAGPNQARDFLLKFAFANGIPDQTLIVRLNGEDIRRFSSDEIGMQKAVGAEMKLHPKTGMNLLEFVYGDWNHGKQNYGPTDPRKLAVAVKALSLQAVN